MRELHSQFPALLQDDACRGLPSETQYADDLDFCNACGMHADGNSHFRGTQPSQLKSCRLHTLQLTKIVLYSSQITDLLQPVRASYK